MRKQEKKRTDLAAQIRKAIEDEVRKSSKPAKTGTSSKPQKPAANWSWR